MMFMLLLFHPWSIQATASTDCPFLQTTITLEEQHSSNSSGHLNHFHPNNFTYIHKLFPVSLSLDSDEQICQIIKNDNISGKESVVYESSSKLHLHASSQNLKFLALYEDCCFGYLTSLSILNLVNDSRFILEHHWRLRILSLMFSANGKHLLVCDTHNVSIWNSLTGQKVLVVPSSPTFSAIGNDFLAYHESNRLTIKSLRDPYPEVTVYIPGLNRIFISDGFVTIGKHSEVRVYDVPFMQCKFSLSIGDILVNDAMMRKGKLFLATSDGVLGVYDLNENRRLFSARLSSPIHNARFSCGRLSTRVFNTTLSSYKTRTYNYGKACTKQIRCHVIPLPEAISQMIVDYAKPGFNQRIYQIPESVTRVYIDNLNIVFSIRRESTVLFSSHSISTGRRHELLNNVPLEDFNLESVVRVGDSVIGLSKSGDLITRSSSDKQYSIILKEIEHFDVLAAILVATHKDEILFCTLNGKLLWTRTVDGTIIRVLLDSSGVSVQTSTCTLRYDLLGNNQAITGFATTSSTYQMILKGAVLALYDPSWRVVLESFDIGLEDIRVAKFIDDKLVIVTGTVWSVIEL